MDSLFEGAPIISMYTRADAIADGVLIDVSEMAKEASFRFPVAITQEVWGQCIDPSEEEAKSGQSSEGRLWDTLNVMRAYAKNADGNIIKFPVQFGENTVTLKAIIGPGDDPKDVISINFP